MIDGRRVGKVRGLNGPNQWIEVGALNLAPGAHRIELVRPKRSLAPGDGQHDILGPVALVADVEPKLVSGAALKRVCGQPADWIDVVR